MTPQWKTPKRRSLRILHVALKWPGIQRVVDAAVTDNYVSSCGSRDHPGGDGRENREYYERLGAPGPFEPAHDQRRSTGNYRGHPGGFYSI